MEPCRALPCYILANSPNSNSLESGEKCCIFAVHLGNDAAGQETPANK